MRGCEPHVARAPRAPRAAGGTAIAALACGAVAALVFACSDPAGPRGGGSAFDGQAAFALVERQVAFGPRVPNTPAHGEALAFLAEYLTQRADRVVLEPFEHVVTQGDTLRLTNVLASFAPDVTPRILLAAHWDTRPVAERDPDPERRRLPIPGANDGASGVAVLLAVADALASDPLPAGVGVDVLLLDGEDYGHNPSTLRTSEPDMYLGAKEFVRAHPAYPARFGILLDLVGDAQPGFPREGFSVDLAPEVVEEVWRVARDLGYGDLFPDEPVRHVTDDHVYLNRGGIPTIDIIDFDYPSWHTSADTPDKLSATTLDAVGELLLELVYNRS